MKRAWLGALAIVAVLVTWSCVICAAALADEHYYAIVQMDPPPSNTAVKCCMLIRDGQCNQSGGFIDQTLWEGTANSDLCWMEVGYSRGYWSGKNVLTYYWADSRPGYPLREVQIKSLTPQVGDWPWMKVGYSQGNTWSAYIYLNGQWNWVGTSSPNGPGSIYCATGMESSSTQNHMGTSSSKCEESALAYLQTGGSWISAWLNGTLYSDPGFNVQWGTEYQSILNWH